MRQTGKTVATVGAAMLVLGLGLPFLVGTVIPPIGYSILQLGGIALLLIGLVVMALGGKGR
jgi:hypothetical protein